MRENGALKSIWMLIKMNLVQNMFTLKFIVVTLLISGVFFLAAFDTIRYLLGGDFSGQSDIVCVFSNLMGTDRFKPIMIILLAGMSTTAFCKEWMSHYDRFILSRCSVTSYVYGKVISNIIEIYVSMGVAVFIFIFILHFGFHMDFVNYNNLEFTQNSFFPYQDFIINGYPVVYILITSFIFSTGVIFFSLLGMIFSMYFPNKFVALATPYISYYVLCTITLFFPDPFVILGISSGLVFLEKGALLNFLYCFFFFAILIFLSSLFIKEKVKRRCKIDTI